MPDDQYPPSPVPSDADLWPGELPFTAFGWVGEDMLDLRVFDQDIYWVNRVGQAFLVAEMSLDYVANVVVFLVENVDYFYRCTLRRAALQIAGDLMLGRLSAEQLAEEAGAPKLSDLRPIEWLEATPLMRTLRNRLAHGTDAV